MSSTATAKSFTALEICVAHSLAVFRSILSIVFCQVPPAKRVSQIQLYFSHNATGQSLLNIIACRIARRAGADYIGTNKLEDVPLLLSHARDRLKIKCHGQIGDLEAALAFREAGCARIEIAEPISILEAWKARCGAGG